MWKRWTAQRCFGSRQGDAWLVQRGAQTSLRPSPWLLGGFDGEGERELKRVGGRDRHSRVWVTGQARSDR